MKKNLLWVLLSAFLVCMVVLPGTVSASGESVELPAPEKVGILQEGQLLPTADAFIPEKKNVLGTGDENFDGALEALYQGMKARQTEINLSAYHIPLTQSEFDSLWYQAFYGNGDLFYVNWTTGASGLGGYLSTIKVAYNDSVYSDEMINNFYAIADSIVDAMPSGLSDQEKALYMHDYLATHCEYDLTYSNYNSYNVLVEKSAVCQGYALAYEFLCKCAGLTSYYVTSNENNHAWNIVVINGKNYFVDCTWDDPSNYYYESRCQHKNFLRSRDGMVSTGHSVGKADWTCYEFGNVSTFAKDSKEYDSYYWSEVNTAMPFIGTQQAYVLSTDTSNVYLRTNNGAQTTVPIGVTARWNVFGGGGSWSGNFGSMTVARGDYYFNTEKAIYRMTTDGTVTKFYDLTAAELSTGYLYGLVTEGNSLAYSTAEKGWRKAPVKDQDGNIIEEDPFDYSYYTRKLLAVCKVSFDGNGGSGEMDTQTLAGGSSYVLPACGFTAPANKEFIGYEIGGTQYAVGDTIPVNGDVNVKVLWQGEEPAFSVSIAHTCAVQNNLAMNYKVKINTAGVFNNVRLHLEVQEFAGESADYTWKSVDLTKYQMDSQGRYVFTFSGIAAAEMGNLIRATVLAEKDNVEYESDVDVYSIKMYAEAAISMYENSTVLEQKRLVTLLVDMLNYGAQAQIHFGRNTGSLANENLSDTQLKKGTALPTSFVNKMSIGEYDGAITASVMSRTLSLGNSVALNVFMNFDNKPDKNVKVVFDYYTVKNNHVTATVYGSDFAYDSVKNRYCASLDSVSAADFGQPISITIYDGTTQISLPYVYSYESYVYAASANYETNQTNETLGKLVTLMRYMMAYSTSAQAFFG